eukprot:4934387-Prymnesium_polylepis.1
MIHARCLFGVWRKASASTVRLGRTGPREVEPHDANDRCKNAGAKPPQNGGGNGESRPDTG